MGDSSKSPAGSPVVVEHKYPDEEQAIVTLTKFVVSPLQSGEDLRKREDAISDLGQLLSRTKRTTELRQLIELTRPFLISLGKAKAARMVRDLVDLCLKIDQDGDVKIALIEESIGWATQQNHVFLRQALEARLVRLFNDLERYPKALEISTKLGRELKKLGDKDLLLEVELEESKAYYFLSSLSKARTSLTSARTIANSTYVPPKMQAGLDMQSGILHAADERDFQTAFSYFYEAFEGFKVVKQAHEATLALKYMILCKVMLNKMEEVSHILNQKHAVKYAGDEIIAMLAISNAAKKRSLKDFQVAFNKYKKELRGDPVVRKHFDTLNETMLEKELCRVIEPYSYVFISHIAKAVELSESVVEKKLAQMILDQKFTGSLHQGEGMLIVYTPVPEDDSYDVANNIVKSLGKALDILYTKAQKIQ